MSKPSLLAILSADSTLRWGIVMAAILLLMQWLALGIFIWQLPPEIPLFYSLPLGKMRLAERSLYMLLPALSTVMVVVQLILIRLSIQLQKIYLQILAWGAALVVFLSLVAMVNILLLAL